MSTNLAEKNAQKLEELKKLFMTEAVKYNVLPIDDRSIERFDAKIAGRPDLMNGRKKLTLYQGATMIMENAFINMKNTSYSITAEVEITGANTGVLICQGGDFGGWSLYMKDGKPAFAYNWLGIENYDINASQKLSPGKHTITFEFKYEGGRGKGGQGILSVDGTKVAEGNIKNTHSNVYGLDEPADVGTDSNTPVTAVYHHNPRFNGKIKKVTIELM
jgi:arylsulfatase